MEKRDLRQENQVGGGDQGGGPRNGDGEIDFENNAEAKSVGGGAGEVVVKNDQFQA